MTVLLRAPYDAYMPRLRTLLAPVVIATVVLALITSCSAVEEQKATLPDGTRLLADSATAMRTVTSTRFAIDIQGNVSEIRLRSAEGQLTREGSAKGTANINQGTQVVELGFVILGETLYLRPPTGPVQKLPLSLAGAVYDPSVILNPDRGIAAVLASGKGATTEAREQVGGVDSYRLRVDFPAQPLSTLVPGPPKDKTGQIWVAAEGFRLVQAQFPAADPDGKIIVRFSEYDVPVEITAPA
ncbi:MAG TPA: LppX_LprAFG lipoprotein [Pseudonocardiaceae bacterium]|nr:LppX_LprAFG lipoprotein [Pseudonocardiaceae bacterium]